MERSGERPPCPNGACPAPHVVRNGSLNGRQRYHCRGCGLWFGATHGTPLYRLNALTRKTHAFAKTPETWDALLDLAIVDHHWLCPHPALRLPLDAPPHPHTRRFHRRTPAMALALTDHPWTWTELLTMPSPVTR